MPSTATIAYGRRIADAYGDSGVLRRGRRFADGVSVVVSASAKRGLRVLAVRAGHGVVSAIAASHARATPSDGGRLVVSVDGADAENPKNCFFDSARKWWCADGADGVVMRWTPI